MSYQTQYDQSSSPTFLNRVTMAMVDCAINIAAEPVGTANHVNRAVYAMLTLNDQDKYGPKLARGCADQGMTDASTDADIKNACSAIWNAFAGVV